MNMDLFGIDRGICEDMLRVRRSLHQNPELAHREFETSSLLRRELEAAKIEAIRPVMKTGLMIDITGRAGSGPTLAIRGDIDALPIQERSSLPFMSKNAGIMHACGHDTHAAMALAVALHFQSRREEFSGTLRFLFQHSEEDLPSGALQFLEAGCLDGVDAVIGLHVDPLLPNRSIAVRAGTYACSSDHFDIEVTGLSCHGGKPHEGVDAISVACSIVGELDRIRSHNADPLVPLTMTVGVIKGGTACNVVSEKACLSGTIRAGREDVRWLAHQKMRSIANSIAAMHGATVDVKIEEDAPVLENDAGMAELIRNAAVEVGGEDCFIDAPMWTASDDFAYFSRIKPGVYFRLGVANDELGYVRPLHHPEFAVDEASLPLGVAVLIRAASNFLKSGKHSL